MPVLPDATENKAVEANPKRSSLKAIYTYHSI